MNSVIQPEYESFKSLLLDMAQKRSVEELLQMIVDRLAERPPVALARIWLIKPGDLCACCRFEELCLDHSHCLHLASSAGRSVDGQLRWKNLQGGHKRVPVGGREIGRIAQSAKPMEIDDLQNEKHLDMDWEWVEKEKIVGVCGQPLIHNGEVLGVLMVFVRIPPMKEGQVWVRMVADHAAASIANARAFEEIDRLKNRLEMENSYLREEVQESHSFGEIVGQSHALQRILQQIELVSPTDASVLVLGESGTGKELVAREIHKRSQRADRPMIKVNCASVPKELYESEFYGHVRGAFTGALKDRVGKFQAADGGTLFLDEIGEIPLELQAKLLRVLQEGEYERVGEDRTRKVDVRLIAATNRDLKKEVEAGRFRQDLFYRVNVFPVEVPPLRERKEDIPLLAAHFLKTEARKLNCDKVRLTEANVIELQNHEWEGNIRELQNVIQRAVITARCGRLRFDVGTEKQSIPVQPIPTLVHEKSSDDLLTETQMRNVERDNIIKVLQKTHWKIYGEDGAAVLLGIKPTTLASRIKKFGIKDQKKGGYDENNP